MEALTDHEIIRQHSPSVRGRAYIELQIVNELIAAAAKAGYALRVQEYEDDGETDYDVRSAIFNLDDAHVIVCDSVSGAGIGWVRLVMGNDGYDVVSDYSTNLEAFLASVNALSAWWGD